MSVINTSVLDKMVSSALEDQITASVEAMVTSPEWINALRQLLVSEMTRKVLERVNQIDVNGTIANEVKRYIAEYHQRNLPDVGIVDRATEAQIVVSNDGVSLTAVVTKTVASEHIATQDLTVANDVSVSGQLVVGQVLSVANGRVGINTPSPDAALAVWDEDIAISIGKHSPNTAYVGTSRAHNLVIGVNRTAVLTVSDDRITVPALTIGKHSIGFAAKTPTTAGNKGDIVFNTEPSETAPIAWVCQGDARWLPKT